MKAIVQTGYGAPEDVLRLAEIDKPEVREKDVLVRVCAASVHADVWHVVAGLPYILRTMGSGLFAPKCPIPGTDLAGTVVAVGQDVVRFKVGDPVFGETHSSMQWKNGGAFAEYASVAESTLALKPEAVTFEQAAAVPTAGCIALANLRGRAEIQPGQHVLINGAAGGVGTIALQVAKARGARVTGVDRAEKLELLGSLGADELIDYTERDFTSGDARYDLIFDVASTCSLAQCKPVLSPTGTYVMIGHDHYGALGRRLLGSLPRMFGLMARGLFDRHLPAPDFSLPPQRELIAELKGLLESGELTPIVDRTFPLEEGPDAIRYLQEGRALGKIIVAPQAG